MILFKRMVVGPGKKYFNFSLAFPRKCVILYSVKRVKGNGRVSWLKQKQFVS